MEFTQPIELPGRHYGNNRWFFKSWKLQREVHFYSDLEYENALILEFDPRVAKYCEQPTEIKDDQGNKSIPDVWVQYRDLSEAFEECKYETDLDESNPDNERAIKQVKLQERWCELHGYKHILRTEKVIRANPVLLDNYIEMHSYLRNHLHPVETEIKIVERQVTMTGCSLRELHQTLNVLNKNAITEAVVWLIAQDRVMSNVETTPFGPMTEVRKK